MQWIIAIFKTLIDLAEHAGYSGIVFFMALESSFVPFPSEVVMGPAGVLASRDLMNPVLAVLLGTVGSVLGALFNYWLAVKMGRPFFVRYGKWLLVSEKTFGRAERLFQRHGEIATFVCRLIPGIRQYVSLPAGLARMHLGRFALFTALGAGIWCTVLVMLGMGLGEIVDAGQQAAAVKAQAISVLLRYVAPSLAVLIAAYVAWNRWFRERDDEPEQEPAPESGS